MKWYSVLALLFLVALISVRADDEESGEDDGLAQPCDAEACQLPNCRCSSTDIPGGLNPRDTPQFVTVTFDDAVNVNNIETYRRLIYNRQNSKGCAAGATFYVNHEYTNYQLVNELYNNGFEIALHSVTHLNSQEYWAEASYETMKEEFADQMIMMSHFANIPYSSLTGVRIPFLQMGGNSSFEVMHDYGLKYDCSMPTIAYSNPGLWPYTLDYMSTQDCIIPPCPTASIPGVWVYPMIAWWDLQGYACSFVDSCFAPPDLQDEEAWFKFILTNFERHYLGNRAPFGFYVHEWFISINPAVFNALNRFLNLINSLEDVFMVNSDEVIEWVKNPVPIPDYKQQACPTFIPTTCSPALCPLDSDHNDIQYWMSICNVCPQKYPWIGNPLGQ